MEVIKDRTYDEERALYESDGVHLVSCRFEGEADGESALKESKNIITENCYFDLRYPFWHDENVIINGCEMTKNCRAPLWYTVDAEINDSKIYAPKALRECSGVKISGCHIESSELGWDCLNVAIRDGYVSSDYFLSRSRGVLLENVKMEGKYSFQYIENGTVENCVLNTKDAFWHARNVTVRNSVINGEYLGWYSEGVTFENCVIAGTQPLCYCKNLRLINCQMNMCDLAVEKSCVYGEITTPIISVKNVLDGEITAPRVDKIIKDREEYKGVIKEIER